jgi:hypothetical protein
MTRARPAAEGFRAVMWYANIAVCFTTIFQLVQALPAEALTVSLEARPISLTRRQAGGAIRNLPLGDVFNGTDLQVRLLPHSYYRHTNL